MHIDPAELPAAIRTAVALLTASTSPEAFEAVDGILEDVLMAPDPLASAALHALGNMAVALTAVELLARSKGIELSEALQEVGLAAARRFPEGSFD